MLSFFFLTAPCCWKRHFVRWIFDLGAKEGDKAGSNWPPAYDLVPFKVELTPNHLISFLENTSSRSTCKICLHACAEWELNSSKISREKRSWSCKTSFLDMIVANSRPKAFEVCASIQIHQSAYGDRWKNLCEAGLGFWADNGRDTLIGGSGSTNRGNSRDYCWSKEQTKERFGTRHNISWLEHMNMFVENTIVTITKM